MFKKINKLIYGNDATRVMNALVENEAYQNFQKAKDTADRKEKAKINSVIIEIDDNIAEKVINGEFSLKYFIYEFSTMEYIIQLKNHYINKGYAVKIGQNENTYRYYLIIDWNIKGGFVEKCKNFFIKYYIKNKRIR